MTDAWVRECADWINVHKTKSVYHLDVIRIINSENYHYSRKKTTYHTFMHLCEYISLREEQELGADLHPYPGPN